MLVRKSSLNLPTLSKKMISPYQFISDKQSGKNHPEGDIKKFINDYLQNKVEDSQLSAWLMAVCFNGMTTRELNEYVNTIINSGKSLDFSDVNGYVVDKHSTGGVGDKVSLIAGPILAACGCYVPMIVGRSLAHTGGTLDKLESINGFNGDLSIYDFKRFVKKNNLSIIGQNAEICPADKSIYSIRDITSTIISTPLICGSIISKKKAEGISGLVLDIKMGNGAFMKNAQDAKSLGEALTNLGKSLSINSEYIISDMNQPLGQTAGLWCEVEESINFLKNIHRDKNLNDVVIKICLIALKMAQIENPAKKIEESILSGKAYEIFEKMISSQKGDINKAHVSNDAKYEHIVLSEKSGFIKRIDTEKLGNTLIEIGGGRKTLKDKIDFTCGLRMFKKIGDKINKNEPIIKIFGSNQKQIDCVKNTFKDIIFISNDKINNQTLIYE